MEVHAEVEGDCERESNASDRLDTAVEQELGLSMQEAVGLTSVLVLLLSDVADSK